MFDKILFVIGRLLQAIPSVAMIVVISFLLTRALPGDPAVYFAGAMADQESIEQTRKTLGLDKSQFTQFVIYVKNLSQGNFGFSLNTGRTVFEELKDRLPASLELTFLGLLLSISIAIPLGIFAALKPNSWIDHACRIIVTIGVSFPIFFTGLFLVYIFYYLLGFAPSPIGRLDFYYLPPPHVTGSYVIDSLIAKDFEVFVASVKQLILPVVTLGIFALAPIARMTRASMIAALNSDYIRTAKASGLTQRKIIISYAFKNSLIPILTTLGMVFSFLLGANVLVEKVFSWPGIGLFAVDALVASDYASVQGFVLSIALLFVVINLIIDLFLTIIDPRLSNN